jgi:hypothetical protein
MFNYVGKLEFINLLFCAFYVFATTGRASREGSRPGSPAFLEKKKIKKIYAKKEVLKQKKSIIKYSSILKTLRR